MGSLAMDEAARVMGMSSKVDDGDTGNCSVVTERQKS